MHLWFLHLVFAMTVLLSPMLGWVARGRLPRGPVLAVCLVATVGCAIWLEPRLVDAAARLGAQAAPTAYPVPDLGILLDYIAPFVAFAPAGLAIGLARPMIDRWHQSSAFRRGTVLAALGACAIHLSPVRVPLSREIFSIAVFIAILRPVAPRPFVRARALARWSFVVYILHFGFVIAWQTAFERLDIQRTAFTSVVGAATVVVCCLATGRMLRRLLPFDWLLPLVEVTSLSRRAATSGTPS
jgi:hypothetical protein